MRDAATGEESCVGSSQRGYEVRSAGLIVSFLNRFSGGKNYGKGTAQAGVKLQAQRLERATTRLLLQEVATVILPKNPG